jgi:hypothetical protein
MTRATVCIPRAAVRCLNLTLVEGTAIPRIALVRSLISLASSSAPFALPVRMKRAHFAGHVGHIAATSACTAHAREPSMATTGFTFCFASGQGRLELRRFAP